MHEPGARHGASGAVVGALAVLLVFGVVAPAGLVLYGALHLSPLLGQQPTSADRATAAGWCWVAFVASAVAFIAVLAIAIIHRTPARTRGLAALVLLVVLAAASSGCWLAVAVSRQSALAPGTSALPAVGGGTASMSS